MPHTPIAPKSVQIIRHGEKPSNPGDPELSGRGKERARALARDHVRLFGPLDYLFAASDSTESLRRDDYAAGASHPSGHRLKHSGEGL